MSFYRIFEAHVCTKIREFTGLWHLLSSNVLDKRTPNLILGRLVQKIHCSKLHFNFMIFAVQTSKKTWEFTFFTPTTSFTTFEVQKKREYRFLCSILFVSGLECQKHECTFSFQLKLWTLALRWAELDIRFCQIKTFLVKDHVLFWRYDAMRWGSLSKCFCKHELIKVPISKVKGWYCNNYGNWDSNNQRPTVVPIKLYYNTETCWTKNPLVMRGTEYFKDSKDSCII